jgi:hypothetical protein
MITQYATQYPLQAGPRVFDGRRMNEEAIESKNALEAAKTRKYEADAERAELQLALDKKAVLPRQPIRDATAVAFSMVAQSLRSLPDVLEAEANLTPEQAEIVEKGIHAICESLAQTFKQMNHDE